MTRIPKVKRCEAVDCGFNQSRRCHAAAIQVGDALGLAEPQAIATQDPKCDTYTRKPGAHFGAVDFPGWVGACKMESCQHNQDLRCTADEIVVAFHDGHADCKTYRPRLERPRI